MHLKVARRERQISDPIETNVHAQKVEANDHGSAGNRLIFNRLRRDNGKMGGEGPLHSLRQNHQTEAAQKRGGEIRVDAKE